MKKNKSLFVLMGICLCIFALVVGCGKNSKDSKPKKDSEVLQLETSSELADSEATAETEEDSLLDKINAGLVQRSFLTGEWIDTELVKHRPVAIMTENTKACLPQYGLSHAGVIYECPVEGGITRLMTIYQDYKNLERVGNVRSCRMYYIYFAKEFDAIYLHAGENSFATPVLESTFIDNINAIKGKSNPYFDRISDGRKAPHNLYTSGKQIDGAIEKYGYRKEFNEKYKNHYQFAEDDSPVRLENGQDAKVVKMYYVNPRPWFEYNEEDGLYYRYEFGEAQIDGLNKEHLAVKNIIIQECNRSYYDDAHTVLNLDYLSGGKGKYITNGKCIDISWKRKNESSPTKYYDSEGKEIVLNQGKTWVAVVEKQHASKNVIYATKEEFTK